MDPYKQENRIASVAVDGKGKDDLLLNAMNGVDKVGEPYIYTIEMLKNIDAKIDISDLVGKKILVTLKTTSKKTRFFHGYIADIRSGGAAVHGLPSYYAMAVPWIWFLKKSSNNRIFRDKTVKDILTTVFKSAKPSFEDFETGDLTTRPKLEHCVQYRETDYTFVHRLMEEYGISYYFKHHKDKHIMALIDSSGKRPKPADKPGEDAPKEINYIGSTISDKIDTLSKWERQKRVVTDAFSQADFNFADKDMFPAIFSSKAEGTEKQGDFEAKSFEHYTYEAGFEEGVSDTHDLKTSDFADNVEKLAKVKLGAYEAERDIIYAQGNCRRVHAGFEFKLVDYDYDSKQNNKEYYVTSVRHQLKVDGYGQRVGQDSKGYSCSLTAIPKETEYYPLQITPKARIYGPQTATVVGEKASDKKLIYTDKLGRIKICFHWDRVDDRKKIDKVSETGKDSVDKDTKNLSCWVRVSQGLAGNKWGSFFLPRIGQEVIVEFLDGDPDRPIITGSVYNGKNLTPYKLPGHNTISTIKSENVSKKGEKAEKPSFNEIRFEDQEKGEQIFIHAAKAMDTQVLGDQRTYIGNNMQLTIDGDDKGSNKDRIEKKSDDSEIGHRDVVIMKGNDQLAIGEGNLIQVIGGGSLLDIKKHYSIAVAGAINVQVGDKIIIAAGKDIHIKSEASLVVESKENISFKAGGDITLDAKGVINLNSKDEILAKGASGIGLTGGSSTIDISSNLGLKGGSNVVIKGSKIDMNGAPPKNPASPAAGLSPDKPTIESIKDLKKAKVSAALKEDEIMKSGKPAKEIEFGSLDK